MIRREHDTELIDKVFASPHVRPFVCYHDREVDWWPAIRGCCVLSNGKDAISIFEEFAPREWQGHILFDISHRGREAVETAKEMLAYMIPKWADRIVGGIPMRNRPARLFMRRIGMTPIGFDEYENQGVVELFEMRKQ